MKYSLLGNSDISISVIGFGAWAIGGRQWGAVADEESVAAIEKARDFGVNFFDTADVYGFGHSEELLGKTIGHDPNALIATKVGLRWNSKGKIRHDLSAGYIRQACEASLKRLRRETIDIYQIHWPDAAVPLDETIEAVDSLVAEGKIRYAGVCNFPVESIEGLNEYPWFVSYQGLFHLFDLGAKTVTIPFCQDSNLAFIAYEPLAKGLLTGKFDKMPSFGLGDHRKYDDRFTDEFLSYKTKVDTITAIATGHNMTPAQLALAFLLYSGATVVIPGVKTVSQIEENIAAARVDKDLLRQLEPEIMKSV